MLVTLIRATLAAPPVLADFSRGAVSSRYHMARTDPSGRSWLILEPITLVTAIVMTRPHATVKNPKPNPIQRSTPSTTKNVRMPMPHDT